MSVDTDAMLRALYGTLQVTGLLVLIGLLVEGVRTLLARFLASIFGNIVYLAWGTLFLPGTLMHELAHAAFITATGGRVTEIVVREDSFHPWTLYCSRKYSNSLRSGHPWGTGVGHVSYRLRGPYALRALQRLLGSAAPTIVGLVCVYFLTSVLRTRCDAWWQYVLCGYLLVCALLSSSMSSTDVLGMLPGLPFCLLLVYIAILWTGWDPAATFASWLSLVDLPQVSFLG